VVRLSDKSLFEPISRQKTYELVADRLLSLISSRHLGPGDAIPSERELVHLYGVGRSSIREALRMLESKGVIRSEANGGFTVAEFGNALNHSLDFLLSVDEADYGELFEVRRILEGEAAALAASRRLDSEVARMGEEVDAMEAGLDSQEGFITADLRFHLIVAEASRNRVVVHLMHAIRALLQRSLASSYHIPGSPEGAIELHRLILEAIAKRRPEEARQRMQEHVSRVERDIEHRSVRTGGRR
jgi:GntR family transcriptional regulator, transcriptional repressor for pyruvate dehydrogenase complex